MWYNVTKGGYAMLFTIGINNTMTELGLIDGGKILAKDRISSVRGKTSLEYAVLFRSFLDMNGVGRDEIDGAILSSVVPYLTDIVQDAVKRTTGCTPLVVGPGIKNGLKIRIDDPKQLGVDIVARTVGGIERYGAPLILINMGSATTFSAVNAKGEFVGTVIVPGVGVSLNALVEATSQLPGIDLNAPRHVVGTNTVDSMKSGIVFGQAALIDGLVERICEEMDIDPAIAASGAYASTVVPACRTEITIDEDLLLVGLRAIYEKNRRSK